MARATSRNHPHIPIHLHPSIFPLYSPTSIDIVIFWEITSEQRSGHIMVSGITLGASHGALNDVIEAATTAKIKRSMYAETRREKAEILSSIRNSEWNAEMDPMVLFLNDLDVIRHDFTQGFVETRFKIRVVADFLFFRPRRTSASAA